MTLARLVEDVLGPELPVTVELPDGSVVGPPDAPARLVFRSRDALRRLLTAPGELGFARAYVAGELDVEGDIYAGLALQDRFSSRLSLRHWAALAREVGVVGVRPLPPPPVVARLRGMRHSQ